MSTEKQFKSNVKKCRSGVRIDPPFPNLVGLSGAAKTSDSPLYSKKKKKKEAKNIKENFLDEKNPKMAKRYHACQGSQVLIVSNFLILLILIYKLMN